MSETIKFDQDRLKKVTSLLVSQSRPADENSPYFDLSEKQKVKIDFRPFIHVEGVSGKEVRTQKVDLSHYTAIILTSRNAVDHYFRIAEELRFKVPDSMKYFCLSEAVAYYLQKYVVYRKRKIYVGKRTFSELAPLIKKYKSENFPDFDQKGTRIAVFGNTTVKAATDLGLRVDIQAPTPETPSMTMALEKYIKEVNNKK